MEFVAIDVETANANMASICQIGIARFSKGEIVGEWKSYVNPEDFFDPINISIHRIDESVVVAAPTFGVLARAINTVLEGRIVVTHTAFDRVAIYQAAKICGAAFPSCTWLDSASVARRAWKQFSKSGYGLKSVCDSIGYKYEAHDALEDAKAAGQIVIAAMSATGMDLTEWLSHVRRPINSTEQQRVSRQGNPDGELHGEVLVFTGMLGIPRHEAADLAASTGCEVEAGVTKRATSLVIGDQDVRLLAGHEKSAKHRKAEELIKGGQIIRILSETDFRELLKVHAQGKEIGLST